MTFNYDWVVNSAGLEMPSGDGRRAGAKNIMPIFYKYKTKGTLHDTHGGLYRRPAICKKYQADTTHKLQNHGTKMS